MPLVGVYSRMGYRVLLTSAKTGLGIDSPAAPSRAGAAASVVVGQSGVGKSSLLNMIEPGLNLRVAEVSAESQKGRHTTTTAQLLRSPHGGYVIDTPGIRQFQLWDVIPEEVAGCYRDLRPYGNLCKFPNCTHTHEADCAVKDAVADGRLDARRYESYCHLLRRGFGIATAARVPLASGAPPRGPASGSKSLSQASSYNRRSTSTPTPSSPKSEKSAAKRTRSPPPRSKTSATNTPAPSPPPCALAAESLTLERRLSDLVNEAYHLTPEEITLLWQTAPPRMPIVPTLETLS